MQFARLNGIVVHFEDSGEVGLPVIVFSNSLGTDFRIWDLLIEKLKGRYRIIRYDKRGHGLSDAPPAPYAMEDHVSDLAALLGHLGVARAAVCGLSVGGVIAQGLAASRPDLVRALILCDTAHKIGTEDMWNARIAAVTIKGVAGLAEGILERWFTPSFRAPDNPAFRGCRNMLVRSPVEGYAGTCAALRYTDYTQSSAKLSVPSLAIVGEQDGSTPPDLVRSMADLIPGCRFEVIAGAGHIPCVEQPDRLATLIDDFLSQTPA